MNISKRNIGIGTALVSAIILTWAVFAQRQLDADIAAKIATHRVSSEAIQTTGLLPPGGRRTVRTGFPLGQVFPVTNVATSWAHAETADWILLNGVRGTALCPDVLSDFGAANARFEAMSLEQIWLLASGYENGPLKLNVRIPRFAAAPEGLRNCTGFAYDKETGRLRVGRKYVAYLSSSQPQLSK